jgi:eukaryotic-like serine/threonine-protein kinase
VQDSDQEPSEDGLPSPGDLVAGKYRIRHVIGRGGMGVVYAAHHELLGQSVAMKVLRPEAAKATTAIARFINEGRAAARLENVHVARVMDVGTLAGGLPFLVFEMLDGIDLAGLLETSGPLPVTSAVDYLMEAMEAVAEAHSVGIIHRDLKPSNLFLARRKDGETIKVLDFGIAKALTDDSSTIGMTATHAVLGSPLYMSPEQLRSARDIDARADIWSLGVIAYELLSGQVPVKAPNVVALFAAIQENEIRPLSELRPDAPPGLVAAVHRCLQRAATDRFACVTDLAVELAPHGSSVAAASLQRIRAILPGPRPLAPSGVDLAPVRISRPVSVLARGTSDTVPLGSLAAARAISPIAETNDAVTSQDVAAIPMRRSRAAVVVSVSLALALAIGAGAVLTMRAKTPAVVPATTSASIATPVPPPAQEAPSSMPAATAASPATSTTTATTTATTATATSPPARGNAAARPPAPPRPSCNPPFTIDSLGRRIPKPECL